MNDWNPNILWILCAVICLSAAALIVRDVLNRRRDRQNYARLRRDSEQQNRALQSLAQSLNELGERVGQTTDELSRRQDRLRDALDGRLDAMRRANEQSMSQMRDVVGEKLDGRLAESFRTVNRQLADVHSGLGQMQALAGEFADLKKVLGGVKTRGIWGEMQLAALLEQILASDQFIANAAIPEGGTTRVEFAVRLPASDGEALLPIDSKFPQEDFLRLADAANDSDPMRVEACAAKLERALIEQAKQISEKYIRPPQTADFAVMFLPVESLYAEAVRRDGLCERLQTQYRVLVAGPNTLAALLVSLRMGFRTITLERRSGEVLHMLDNIRAEFDRYQESVDNVRKRLTQTEEALDTLEIRSRKLSKVLSNCSNFTSSD